MDKFGNLLDRLMSTSRGLGVHDTDHFHLGMFLESHGHLLWINNLSPFNFDRMYTCPIPFGHVLHSIAENTVDTDNHLIARLNQITDTSFHAGASGARHSHGHVVFGRKNRLQQLPGFIHNLQVFGIEMADRGSCQSLQNSRGNGTRTRSQ